MLDKIVLVSAVLTMAIAAASAGAEETETEGDDLRQRLLSAYSVLPKQSAFGWRLQVLISSAAGEDDALCAPAPLSEPPEMVLTMIATTCLAREKPDAYSESNPSRSPALMRAAETAAERLNADPEASKLDPHQLWKLAQLEFQRALVDAGVLDQLVSARENHVEARSDCYLEFLEVWQQSSAHHWNATRESGYCESWQRFLNVCTSPEPDVAAHIIYHPRQSIDPAKKRVLEQILFEHGLSECMANVLEARAPDLARQIEQLRIDDAPTAPSNKILGERAWEVWREHGIESWLDLSLEAGADGIPEDVLFKLEKCKAGVTSNIPTSG